MKKLLLIMLSASFMLAAPCLNAGFAAWLSENLPPSLRVSSEYRDEVNYMKEKTKNHVPITFVKSNDSSCYAKVANFGFYPVRVAIMFVNEKELRPDNSARVFAHELKHVEYNHSGVRNTIACAAPIAVIAWTAALMFSSNSRSQSEDENAGLKAISAIAGAYAIMHICNKAIAYYSPTPLHETEAEEGSFDTVQKLGYCKALKKEFEIYTGYSKLYDKNYRIHGDNYPTLGEYILWSEKACKACHEGVNPPERVDTPNIMRNGSPAKPNGFAV